MIEIKNKQDCCGCMACGDVCPKQAIAFPRDNEGFWYPSVDSEKCVGCGLCEKICPMLNLESVQKNTKEELKVYGGYHNDIVIRFDSTSGGIFSALAQTMYSEKGYVSGAFYNEHFDVENYISNSKLDLRKLRSSKYVQSLAGGLYKKIKTLLDSGEKVLACGSPCQMAALRTYLQKDYDNIVIVDFLCRACNSPKVFHKYLESLEAKYGSAVTAIKDKNKDHGWRSLARKVTFADGQTYYGEGHDDHYRRGYHLNVFERPSCYGCKFKGVPRISDITLGDFWGIESIDPSIDKDLGTSLIMLNSAKGREFFKKTKNRLIVKEFTLADIEKGNSQALYGGVVYPDGIDRASFFADLDKMPFDECAEMYFPIQSISKKALLKQRVKKLLRFCKLCTHPGNALRIIKWNTFRKNTVSSVINGKYLAFLSYCALDIAKSARIEMGGDFRFGVKRNRKSKLETRLLLEDNARLAIKGRGHITYGSDIQVFKNASLELGSACAINGGFQCVCMEKIVLGNDVHIGRDVWIRDNNGGHTVVVKGSKNSAPVTIGDHVWICSNVSVTKGVDIGEGAIISANSVVTTNIPAHCMASGNPAKVIAENIIWRP